MAAQDDLHGPVDYLLLEFPDRAPTGGPGRALLDLAAAGLVRVWDLVVVRRTDDGLEQVELDEVGSEAAAGLAALAGAGSGLVDDEDLDAVAETLTPGTLGALLVYENTWAAPFVAAVREAGGDLVASGRIPAQALLERLDELEADD